MKLRIALIALLLLGPSPTEKEYIIDTETICNRPGNPGETRPEAEVDSPSTNSSYCEYRKKRINFDISPSIFQILFGSEKLDPNEKRKFQAIEKAPNSLGLILYNNRPLCSSVHIGNGLALTANHCITGIRRLGVRHFELRWLSALDSFRVSIKDDTLFEDPKLDLALFKTSFLPKDKGTLCIAKSANTSEYQAVAFGFDSQSQFFANGPCKAIPKETKKEYFYCNTYPVYSGGALLSLDLGVVTGIISGSCQISRADCPQDGLSNAANFAHRIEGNILDKIKEFKGCVQEK